LTLPRRRRRAPRAIVSLAIVGGTPRRHFYRGYRLDRALTIADLRAMAHRRLPRFALEYLEGGAEDEATLARNLAALAQWRFRHRSFVDVSRVVLAACRPSPRRGGGQGRHPVRAKHDVERGDGGGGAGPGVALLVAALRVWPAANPRCADRPRRQGRVRGADRHHRRADLRQPGMGLAHPGRFQRAQSRLPLRHAAPPRLARRGDRDTWHAALRERDRLRTARAARVFRQ